ncbi:hypothetical protein EXW93_14010 [Exiguobacterium sp. JMULE1]|uniref:Ig-like domain-containing protein n=1 Tax=Exiguobacterium sp. JMULE1 TaxID=2518339 RepID=UPI001574FE77|nr:Ig-like domain-containing protein [Exiguobacterium sp. JMULE1]NTY10707.1 hypothetical protein [Exiguobacterium sp. JMULE1]
MGTKKSNKLYAAAAALAVTASAVAPGLTADAASKVTVKSITAPKSISHYGGYTFAVKKLSLPKTVKVLLSNKKYENRSVKWGKVSYDKKYIGKYQTISGTVSGTTKKVSIKVKLNNYPVDVVEPKLDPVAVGEKLNLPSTIDVKYKDGKVIARSAKSFNLTAEKTDKAGMMKLSYNYMGKNSSIKGSIAYEVKAAEIMNIVAAEADYELSVSADVKYPAKDAKAELLVYPFKNESAAIVVPAELKDGKFMAKAKDLPVGTHSFAIKVGEVKSEVKEAVVEGAKVLSAEAINGSQIEVKFNKAVDADTIFAADGSLKAGVVTVASLDSIPAGALTATLEGKKLIIKTQNPISKRYDVTIDGVKSSKGAAIAKFVTTINVAADTTAPMIIGTEKIDASRIKVKFSEPVKAFTGTTFKFADGTDAAVTGTIAQGATEAIFTIGSAVEAGKEIKATIIGLQDVAGNIISPNPSSFTFQKGAKDGVAPVVSSLTPMGTTKLEIKFSEELIAAPAVTVDGNEATLVQDATDKTKYVATFTSVSGLKNVVIGAATDLSGQESAAVTKVVNFVADTTAPKLVSSKIVVDATDKKEYLELSYDEEVTVDGTVSVSGTYVKNFITTNVSTSGKTLVLKDDKKTVRVALDSLLLGADAEGGVYNLTLTGSAAGIVKDKATPANSSSKTADVSFTRGKDGVATSEAKATVATYQVVNNDLVRVTFNGAVDGMTATMASNYKIDGIVVEKATLISNAGAENVVELDLKKGSNTFTGLRNVSVEGVKAKGSSVAMDKYMSQQSFNENVAPTVTGAKLIATDTIELTFSEAITDTAGLDFETLVESKTSLGSKSVTVTGATKATITLTPGVTAEQLAKGLSLKALDTLDIKDVKGNKLSVPANIIVTN